MELDQIMIMKSLTQREVLGYYKAILDSGMLNGYKTSNYDNNTGIESSVSKLSIAPEIPFERAKDHINSALGAISKGRDTLESISFRLSVPDEGKERFILHKNKGIEGNGKEDGGEPHYNVNMRIAIDAERISKDRYKFTVDCYGLPDKHAYTGSHGSIDTKRLLTERDMYTRWLNQVRKDIGQVNPITPRIL